VWPREVHAQQSTMPVIGFLGSGPLDSVRVEGLRQGLKEAGLTRNGSRVRSLGIELNQRRMPLLGEVDRDLDNKPTRLGAAPGMSESESAGATPT